MGLIRAHPLTTVPALSERALACALAAATGAFLTTVAFAPGALNNDSLTQMAQAGGGLYDDWHPPLMAFVWRLLLVLVPYQLGMFLLQLALFWGGAALVTYESRLGPRAALFAILGLGVFPPVFAHLGGIWKDVGAGSALLLAVGLLLHAERALSRVALAGAVLALVYGLALRWNMAAAVLPLALWAGWMLPGLWAVRDGCWWRLAHGLLLFLCVGALVFGINRLLTGGRSSHPVQQILVHDLAAVSLHTGRVLLPDYVGADLEALRRAYTTATVPKPVMGPTQPWHTADEVGLGELRAAWLSIIPVHFSAYLSHRLGVFSGLFGIGRMVACAPFTLGEPVAGVQRGAVNYLALAAFATPIFHGWIYLLAAPVLTVWLALRLPRARLPVLAVGGSAVLYEGAYLFVATACDARFHWWGIVAVLALPLVALVRVNCRAPSPAPPGSAP